jgi:hypothetical protein
MGCCQSIILYSTPPAPATDDHNSPAILGPPPDIEAGGGVADEIKDEIPKLAKRKSGSMGGEATLVKITPIPSIEHTLRANSISKSARRHKRSESFGDQTLSVQKLSGLQKSRKSFGSSPQGMIVDNIEIRPMVPEMDPESAEKFKVRSERRKSIKMNIEEMTSRGEEFWKNMLPQPKPNNEVVTSKDAQEAEDSKQEIGFVNQYTFIRQLGEGASGEVKLAMNESDQKFYAVKIMSRKNQNNKVALSRSGNHRLSIVNGIPQEVAMLKKLTHPNMVNLYEVIDDPRIDRLYLIFEYVPGKQFESSCSMTPLPLEKCKKYFRDVVKALLYCHEQGVCHGDIKPENLLISPEDQIKISDFGVSYLINDAISRKRAGMGTPLFTAPEVLSAERNKFKPQPLDVWALGVTLYVFVFGKCPFSAESVLEAHEKIRNQELSFPVRIDPNLDDLLRNLLQKDPEKRITLPEVLTHPWLNEVAELHSPKESLVNSNSAHNELVTTVC